MGDATVSRSFSHLYNAEQDLRKFEDKSAEHRNSEQFVSEILLDYDPDLRTRIERTVKQWNQPIRKHLKTETALRLSTEEDRQAIPVVIKDGYPHPIFDFLSGWHDADLWELLRHKAQISSSIPALAVVRRKLDYLLRKPEFRDLEVGYVLPDLVGSSESDSRRRKAVLEFGAILKSSLDLMDLVEAFLKKLSFKDRMREVDHDILGAYFFHVPRIELYWMVIGLFSITLGVSAESLTVVVLAHELAHGHTHLGHDIEGDLWETQNFANTDLRTVEGLAQFYTESICTKIKNRFPAAHKAYEALLEIQSGPYVVHKDWFSEDDQPGEYLRHAMLNARSKNMREYGMFIEQLDAAKKQVKGGYTRVRTDAARGSSDSLF